MSLSCSFSGHRKIPPEHLFLLGDMLLSEISSAYEEGYRTFYTGGAVGFDTVAAQAVVSFRIFHRDVRLVILVPCIGQEAYYSDSERGKYEYLLSVADEVVFMQDAYSPGCMRKRNAELVARADMLICYVGHDRSGSSQTLALARENGKKIINLYPALCRAEREKGKSPCRDDVPASGR